MNPFLLLCFMMMMTPCHLPTHREGGEEVTDHEDSRKGENPIPFAARPEEGNTIMLRFLPPEGFKRVDVEEGSFASYLRELPLKPAGASVRLFDGRKKWPADVYEAVVDMEIGTRDLQQCADAIIRLRAEYLYTRGETSRIHFCFTSGDTAFFSEWAKGMRPVVSGSRVSWYRSAPADASYPSFRKYLDVVFTYAGTLSLEKEMVPVTDRSTLQGGDVFIEGGSPGHAVMVADVAIHEHSGKKCFLLLQSYMPAQDIHVLKNMQNESRSPWVEMPVRETLETPEWTFRMSHLRRFR